MKQNKLAFRELTEKYHNDIMGQIALAIYEYHLDRDTIYELSDEAEEAYEEIVEKYNEHFNLKWTSSSQSDLDALERSELSTRTKAPEMIGRLAIILWIYTNGKFNHSVQKYCVFRLCNPTYHM